MMPVSDHLSKLLKNINNNNDEYKILTREEELELIEKYRNTDEEKLRQLLICHNIFLAISFSKKYSNTSIDYDSLVQDAFYGLVIASKQFDFDAGVKFSRYAYIWIKKYALSSYYDKHNMMIGLNSVSLDSTVNTSDSDVNNTVLQEIFDIETESESSEYDKYLNCASCVNEIEKTDLDNKYSEQYKTIIKMVETSANITPEEKQIFNYIYINGASLKTVSEYLNKSVQIVRYKREKVLNFLRKELKREYNITSFASLA